MTPIVDGVKRAYRGRLNVVYVSIDRGEGPEIAKEQGVVGTPTIVLLDSQGNQVSILRGSLPDVHIYDAVEDLLAHEARTGGGE